MKAVFWPPVRKRKKPGNGDGEKRFKGQKENFSVFFPRPLLRENGTVIMKNGITKTCCQR